MENIQPFSSYYWLIGMGCIAVGASFLFHAHFTGGLNRSGSGLDILRSYPIITWVMLAIGLVFWGLGLADFYAGGGIRDAEGFSPRSYVLGNREDHDLPIYRQRSVDSPVIRYTERFETLVAAEEVDGWSRVKMDSDGAVGWLPISLNPTLKDLLGVIDALEKSAQSFFSQYKLTELLIEVVSAVVISGLLNVFLGERLSDLIGNGWDLITIIVAMATAGAAYSLLGTEPTWLFSETLGMRSAARAAAIFPTLLGAAVSYFAFARAVEKRDAALGVVVAILTPYMLYTGYGGIAGWW